MSIHCLFFHFSDAETGKEISEEEQQILEEQSKKVEKQPFMFPNWCQYIAYFFVVACSGSSALVCFFYSMMWGPRKSNEWLASMFAGFFQSVCVIQPIKAVVVAVLVAAIFRKPVEEKQPKEEELLPKKKRDKKKKKKNSSVSQALVSLTISLNNLNPISIQRISFAFAIQIRSIRPSH